MRLTIRWSNTLSEAVISPQERRKIAALTNPIERIYWLDFLVDAKFEIETLYTQLLCHGNDEPEARAALATLHKRFENMSRDHDGVPL